MPTIGRKEFEKKLRSKNTGPTEFRFLGLEMIDRIMLAYRLSKYGHRNQTRADGERYFEHPKRVALILLDELNIGNPSMIIAALLHDIKEDSFILTLRDIELIFGENVREMVGTLSKGKSLPKPERDERYFNKLQKASRAVKIIKMADRLDNVRDMKGWTPEKIEEYVGETTIIFLPIAKEVNQYLYQEIKKICEKYTDKELP